VGTMRGNLQDRGYRIFYEYPQEFTVFSDGSDNILLIHESDKLPTVTAEKAIEVYEAWKGEGFPQEKFNYMSSGDAPYLKSSHSKEQRINSQWSR
jgi:hypothetical protein